MDIESNKKASTFH